MKVAIIGAGISGLSAAHRLLTTGNRQKAEEDIAEKIVQHQSAVGEFSDPQIRQKSSVSFPQSVQVTLFESSGRAGGIIETIVDDNLTLEQGPDSFITVKPAALALCRQLGLESRLISTNENSLFRRAFIARRGKLLPIPAGFNLIAPRRYDTFFRSQVLSRWGKLRMALEQFIAADTTDGEDESVASFVRRRFGAEAVNQIAQPMLGGIYTGDIERLSARAVLSNFYQYARDWGSVSRGVRKESKRSGLNVESSGARYSAFLSLDGGMQVLVEALTKEIGAQRIRLNTAVSRIAQRSDGSWLLNLPNGLEERFDAVILALPAWAAARLMVNVNHELADCLSSIEYASSAVVTLLYDRAQIAHALDGFGFVVPPSEKRSIIAGSFTNVKFPARCPSDKVLLRAFIGGTLQADLLQSSDQGLVRMAVKDLESYLGVNGEPARFWIKRWPKSMPQYEVGHLEKVAQLTRLFEQQKNLFFAGAAMHGVGLPDCIASGQSAAESLFASYTGSTSARASLVVASSDSPTEEVLSL